MCELSNYNQSANTPDWGMHSQSDYDWEACGASMGISTLEKMTTVLTGVIGNCWLLPWVRKFDLNSLH